MSSNFNFLAKKIAVLGFGVEGKSAARFLVSEEARVTVLDGKSKSEFDAKEIAALQRQGVEFQFGEFGDLSQFDLVVRSPGVSLKISELQSLPQEKVTSATKLFFDLCPCPIIGVTGTKGKGTTSTLIYEMLKAERKDAHLGGNIGVPPLDFLKDLTKNSIVVLELSSFQLADLHKSPHIAVMLMVTAEHLDYHKDIAEYVDAKRNILRSQSVKDFAILNRDYPASNESDIYTNGKIYFVSRERDVDEGCYIRDGKVVLKGNFSKVKNSEEEVIDTKDILLPGKHNWENVCAATTAAFLAGVSKKTIAEVLKTFKGLEHRLEHVGTVKGVRYFDDSFSTTPETAEAAIEAFEDPEILIMGGSSKNSDFTRLGQLMSKKENIKAIIGIGVEWKRMKEQFPVSSFKFPLIEGCRSMQEVVRKAAELAEAGDVVLLSPGCASFDMFKDYKDRGNQFKEEVNNLR